MLFFFMVLRLRRLGKSAPKNEGRLPKMPPKFAPRCGEEAIRKSKRLKTDGFGGLLKLDSEKFTPRCGARAIWKSKSFKAGSTRQNLHHVVARERFGSQKSWKTERFGRLFEIQIRKKFAPRCGARAILKSKPLRHQVLGTFLEVQDAFRVAGARISTRYKIRGRRRASWRLQKHWQAWWIWRGSETIRFAWQAQGFRALWSRVLKPRTLSLLRMSYSSYRDRSSSHWGSRYRDQSRRDRRCRTPPKGQLPIDLLPNSACWPEIQVD